MLNDSHKITIRSSYPHLPQKHRTPMKKFFQFPPTSSNKSKIASSPGAENVSVSIFEETRTRSRTLKPERRPRSHPLFKATRKTTSRAIIKRAVPRKMRRRNNPRRRGNCPPVLFRAATQPFSEATNAHSPAKNPRRLPQSRKEKGGAARARLRAASLSRRGRRQPLADPLPARLIVFARRERRRDYAGRASYRVRRQRFLCGGGCALSGIPISALHQRLRGPTFARATGGLGSAALFMCRCA